MQNEKNENENPKVDSADRRQFLRTALWAGGAAALLLTGASRKMLATSLALNQQEMEAARRAQQVQGAPPNAERNTERMEARATQPSGMCDGCEGTCSGTCIGCQGSCQGSCVGLCQGSCLGTCSGSCAGMCMGVH